jgi:hypothetical protein
MRGNPPFIMWPLTTPMSQFPNLCFRSVREEIPKKKNALVRFAVICEAELSPAVNISITMFLDETPCRLPDTYRRSTKPSALHPPSITKKEAACSSETSASVCDTTRRHIQEEVGLPQFSCLSQLSHAYCMPHLSHFHVM